MFMTELKIALFLFTGTVGVPALPESRDILRGKVSWQGDPPEIKKDVILNNNKDRRYCCRGDTADPRWKIGSKKGIANVVVWLRAPRGSYFELPDRLKSREDSVKIDQPFCQFEPHVVVLFPSYFDGIRQRPTGQEFTVINSAAITHNVSWIASDPTVIKGENVILPRNSDRLVKTSPCHAKRFGGEQLVTVMCDLHTWMSAYAWVFDHPFAAVTAGGNKDAASFGSYEIKDVPCGMEVEIVYWHESLSKPVVLKKVELKKGVNTANITMRE
jgi:hypothetical protein